MPMLSVRINDQLDEDIKELLRETTYLDISELVRDLLRRWVREQKRIIQVIREPSDGGF